MNTSPKRSDIEIKQSIVRCMTMKALENYLEKGQKIGDATKVVTSGEIESIDEYTPRMETKVESHIVNLDRNVRQMPNGEIMNVKLDKKKREMQFSAIGEAKRDTIIDEDIEK